MNDCLTIGELRELIKDVPDDTPIRHGVIRYVEKDDAFMMMSSSPIHTVEYDPSENYEYIKFPGVFTLCTNYTREGVLGVDDGKMGLDKWFESDG